jgi:hypothetical protein
VTLPLAALLAAAAITAAAEEPKPVDVVPFDLYDGRIFLSVRVNGGEPGDFQFDSAAGRSCLTLGFGRRSRLETPWTATVSGAGDGTQSVPVARDVEFAVGDLRFRAERVPLIDMDELTLYTGRRTDGLVGADLLERYVVAVDYGARALTAYEPAGFEYRGSGAVLAIERRMGGPVVQAVLHMPGRPPLPMRLLFDAPHAGPLVLTTPFVDRHQLLDSARELTPALVPSVVLGVGGESAQLLGRSLSLEIGPYSFQSPVVALSRAKAGTLAAAEIDGLVGSRILGRFRILYDYSRRHVILEPGPRFEEPFTHDMSGLRLRARTLALQTIEVARVAEGSPAEAAGLREGDLLVSVDGRPVRPVGLPEVRARLERPGRVRLELSRGGRRRTVLLELRPRV